MTKLWLINQAKGQTMSTQLVIELKNRKDARSIHSAIEANKTRLQVNIRRTQRRLAEFEQQYGVTTAHFLQTMTAEDLTGGDMEYITWAGEARLLDGLENELAELEDVDYQLP
jgi:hypothetical protein